MTENDTEFHDKAIWVKAGKRDYMKRDYEKRDHGNRDDGKRDRGNLDAPECITPSGCDDPERLCTSTRLQRTDS